MSKDQLTLVQRQALRIELRGEKRLDAISNGYGIRGNDGTFEHRAVVSKIPENLSGAPVSVCGVKGFMVDERREFEGVYGGRVAIRCAVVAVLEIVDSPVHFHAETLEFYTIISGTGKMVLDNEVVDVSAGNVIVIPVGVHHGLVADDPSIPVKVLMTFTPGLAPKEYPLHRDERIVHATASGRIRELIS